MVVWAGYTPSASMAIIATISMGGRAGQKEDQGLHRDGTACIAPEHLLPLTTGAAEHSLFNDR